MGVSVPNASDCVWAFYLCPLLKCQVSSPISVAGIFPDQVALCPVCSRHSKSGSRKWHSEIKCLESIPLIESLQKQGSQKKVRLLTWWFYELPSNTEVWVSKDSCFSALCRPDNQWASETQLINALHNTLIEHILKMPMTIYYTN